MREAIEQAIAQILAQMVGGLLTAVPIWWLWNDFLVGTIDGVHPISYLQGLGLFWLYHLLTLRPWIEPSKH